MKMSSSNSANNNSTSSSTALPSSTLFGKKSTAQLIEECKAQNREEWLPLKDWIFFLEGILILQKPKLFAIILFLDLTLWVILNLFHIPALTLLGLSGIIFCIGVWIKRKREKIWEAKKKTNSTSEDDKQSILFNSFIDFISVFQVGAHNFFVNLLAYRRYNNTKFTIHICTLLLVGAGVGNFLSFRNWIMLLITVGLCAPGIIYHKTKVQAFLKPFKDKLNEKVISKITKFFPKFPEEESSSSSSLTSKKKED